MKRNLFWNFRVYDIILCLYFGIDYNSLGFMKLDTYENLLFNIEFNAL